MGKCLDLHLDDLEKGLERMFVDQDRPMLEFAKKLRKSKKFKAFSLETKARIELYIKAYEGDKETLLNLAAMVLGVEFPGKLNH